MLDHEVIFETPEAPYYLPVADEVDVFFAAYEQRLPVLLKGPGCGKDPVCRARDYALYRGEQASERQQQLEYPLRTVAHEDLSATDLVGRCSARDETVGQDGPLPSMFRKAVFALDEIVEARKIPRY